MKVWIDLHNSPHPLLFAPVVRRLEVLGHEILLTVRDNAQTLELAQARWPGVSVLGNSSPPGRAAKSFAVGQRVATLRRWAASRRPDVALSHNSYAQIMAARLLGIPTVTAMDYEHQPANHLAFRLADRILLPAALPRMSVRQQGASRAKTISYSGLKEEIYLGDFSYDKSELERAGVDRERNRTIVITRPPPSGATYHQFENPLYAESLKVLAQQDSVCCVVLTRSTAQRDALAGLGLRNFVFPRNALDARSLMYSADLVVGAGGTMTREAALLGVPTYTVFAGRRSAVDETLVAQGLLRRLNRPDELERLRPRTSTPVALSVLRSRSHRIIETFVEVTLEAALQPQRHPSGLERGH
jgi:predicted glycosyltransferase